MHVDASGRVASTCRPLGRPALLPGDRTVPDAVRRAR
jgi:hypothetical protein